MRTRSRCGISRPDQPLEETFMQRHQLFKACLATAVAGALLAGAYPLARAADADKAKPLALRKIMQDLGKDMQAITDGIAREDWVLVAKTAPRIANHPQPPMGERMRILAFVGSNGSRSGRCRRRRRTRCRRPR